MTSISVQAAQARENARASDGKFGHQVHDRADGIDLTTGQAEPDNGIEKARAAARRERLAAQQPIEDIRSPEAPFDDEPIVCSHVERIARRADKDGKPDPGRLRRSVQRDARAEPGASRGEAGQPLPGLRAVETAGDGCASELQQ